MIMHIPKSTYYHKWFIGATLVVPVLPLAAQTSPNLVFIMADQYRGDALGCLGKEPVKTPCLDHLLSCFITRPCHADDGHVPPA